ncbi:LLM class F420-dependent oxidoreductase [Nonomuraea sp. TT08I-71]|nr:LLM class F420-dependent oxidoreductase [Nonomuraea sp. TT08I-71]
MTTDNAEPMAGRTVLITGGTGGEPRRRKAGVDNLSTMDHYLQIAGMGLGDADAPMLEGYTTLAFLAAHTTSVELQLLVTGVTYRHPGLLVRARARRVRRAVSAAGRTVRAAGGDTADRAPDVERGQRSLPRQAPPAGRDDQLPAAAAPSTDHDRRRGGEEDPAPGRPLRRRHQPVRPPRHRPEQVRAKLEVLAEHCAREGTDYDRIRKTVLWAAPVATHAEGGEAFTDQMAGYAAVGIEEVHVMPWTGDPVRFVEGLGEHVVPGLKQL